MKEQKHLFGTIAVRYIHWLILELIGAYILSSVIVKGNKSISDAIDTMLTGSKEQIINKALIMTLIACVTLGFMASMIKDLCAIQFSVGIQKQFRKQASRKLLRMEFKYFDQNGSGSILNKMIGDLRMVGEFFTEILPTIFSILVEAGTLIFSIIQMDGMLVVFLAVCYPLVMIVSHFSSKRIAELTEKRWDKVDHMFNIAYDYMGGIIIGKSFNLLPIMDKEINGANDAILRYEFKRNRLSCVAWTMNHLVNFLPNIILSTLALIRVHQGLLTVGEMTYFVLILGRIIHPLGELPGLFNEARSCGVSFKRLEEIMGQKEEDSGTFEEAATATCENVPALTFEDVDFGYLKDTPILKHVNFEIHKGEKVAFVGSSGEGKSTIFKLVCGFYNKSCGSYKLYGKPFEEWNLDAARSLFSLVSQNVFLFPETIAQNIGYGKDHATMDEIIRAAKDANIHDFIMTLPKGYETVVGERGERLSGGQKQRLSIARAFLKDAPILLLDEPTSAIDVGTEELIKEAIERISEGRTVLTIAHRLSTIEDVDCIMVLAKGEIVERGKNEELLAAEGAYTQLYAMQNQLQQEEVG